jgi:hypothetical protein
MQIQLGLVVEALIFLSANERWQLEIPHCQYSRRRRDLGSLAIGLPVMFRQLRAGWKCPS